MLGHAVQGADEHRDPLRVRDSTTSDRPAPQQNTLSALPLTTS